jgi:hypothetical protein
MVTVKNTPPKTPKLVAKAAPKPAARKSASPAGPLSVETASRPKQKLVRDSFTIPKAEYAVLQALKLRAAELKRPVKKSELLRAGVTALRAMNDKAFLAALSAVPSLKTGRPAAKTAAE